MGRNHDASIVELEVNRHMIFESFEYEKLRININLFSGFPGEMFLIEDGFRYLSKLTNCNLCSFPLNIAFIVFKDIVLVALVVKQVIILLCYFIRSLVTKY